jgi:hypothetical protein
MGSFIFTLFLGPEWKEAGSLLIGLSFVAFTTLLVQTFGGIFDVYKQQEKRLIFHISNFIVKVGVLLTCLINELSLQTTIYIFSAVSVAMNLLALQVLFSILNIRLYVIKIAFINSPFLLVYLCITYFLIEAMDNLYFIVLGEVFISTLWGGAIYHCKNALYSKGILCA